MSEEEAARYRSFDALYKRFVAQEIAPNIGVSVLIMPCFDLFN